MKDKLKLQKRIQKMMIIMAVIIIPGLFRVINSDAFESVRNVDIALLFVAGMGTGSLLVMVRIYFRLKKENQ